MLLSVRDIELRDAFDRVELADISFDIHAGEVLGIAGVEGNGQTELVETLVGNAAPGFAAAFLWGEDDITSWSTRDRREMRVLATSRRTGNDTACCSTHRCGRTASSATRRGRRR